MIHKLIRRVRHWFRSAASGRFVSADFADHHRDPTTRETDTLAKMIERFKEDDGA
jgi:hypothetical protein